jgi:hypothetical protein
MIKESLDQRIGNNWILVQNIKKNKQQISSFIFWLFSDSISLTNSQKLGYLFMGLIFVVILSPIALSPSDPYHLQESSEKLQNFLLFLENMFNAYGLNHSDDVSYNYEIIDGIKYRVLFSEKLEAKNPDGGRHLIPGVNDIITSQKF